MANASMSVEVVYAKSDQQICRTLQVPQGSTVEQVIAAAGILQVCPELDLTQHKVGIFSQQCALEQVVQDADRIEIYRPLLQDPKDARRQRAEKTLTSTTKKRGVSKI